MIRRPSLFLVAAALTAALALSACGSSGSSPGASGSTTSTIPPTASAKGKPCVALADPVPNGAPDVPVKVGPPPTTLVVEDLAVGTGAEVTTGSTITADYIGVSCSTGKIFDDSYSRGQPATFSLDGVIPGWQQGLVGMKVGGTRLLGIPADLAYGAQGQPPAIAPDETLWFVVQLRDSQDASATPPSS
jgi:peptidylprolyl isomerase